jgi:DNA-binding FadR family transcriptional regulator
MTAELRHTSVLDAIAMDVVSGVLVSSEPATLEQLQARYEVSRGVLRECIRVLESTGMLKSQRRIGIQVQPVSAWHVMDAMVIRWRLAGPERETQLQVITELRLGIEPVASRLAALRATTEERDTLREIVAKMRVNAEAGRTQRHLQTDLAFHTLVLTASHNELYASMATLVREVLTARRYAGLIHESAVPAALRQHEIVASSIIDGDEQAAEASTYELLSEVRASLATSGNAERERCPTPPGR